MKQASRGMCDAIRALANGASFDWFVRQTGCEWDKIAEAAHRRYGYSGFEPSDIKQVMLLSVWRHVAKHDETKMPLIRYVMWNAMIDARQAINRSKGIHAHSHRSLPSPYVLTPECGSDEPTLGASPEDVARAHAEVRRHLATATTRDAVLVLLALRYGSIALSVKELSDVKKHELALDRGDDKWAREHIARAVKRTLKRARTAHGDQNGNETQASNGKAAGSGRGCEDGQGRRGSRSTSLSRCDEGTCLDGGTSDGTARRRGSRPGGARQEPRAVVPSRLAG